MSTFSLLQKKIRGIRTPIPQGYVLGRSSAGDGDVELIPLPSLGKKLVATGTVVGIGGSSGASLIVSGTGAPPLNTYSAGTIYIQTDGNVGSRIWVAQNNFGNLHTQQVNDGAVHQYRLDETSGTVATDRGSGPASNGTYSGGFTLNQPPISNDLNGCVQLNGSTGFVDFGFTDPPADPTTHAFTIEIVYERVTQGAAFTNIKRLMANDHTDNTGKGFQIFGDNQGSDSADFGFTSVVTLGGGIGVLVDPVNGGVENWLGRVPTIEHLTFVYTGSTTNTVLYYHNGTLVQTQPTSGAYVAATSHVNIGRNPSYNGDYCPGFYSNAAFYNKALTAAQVLSHYSGSRAQWIAIPGV